MTDHFDPLQTTDALARDFTELRDRVRNDPTTRAISALTAIGAGLSVLGVLGLLGRTLMRKRHIIKNVMLLLTAIATFTKLREQGLFDAMCRAVDGPPPPPAAAPQL